MMGRKQDRKQEKKRRTLREDLSMIVRAFQINWKMMNGGMGWRCAEQLARNLVPYYDLYLSARIVDGIAAGASVRELMILAAVTVSGNLILKIVRQLIIKKAEETERMNASYQEFYFFNALNRMQYKYFEQPDTALLYEKIRTNIDFGGYGLRRVFFSGVHGLNGLFHMAVSAALTVSMFRTWKGGKLTGFLGFVNSPVSSVVILFLIFLGVGVDILRSRVYMPKMLKLWSIRSKKIAHCYAMFTGRYDMQIFHATDLALDKWKTVTVEDDIMKRALKTERDSDLIIIFANIVSQLGLFLYVAAKAYIGVFGIGRFVLYRGTVEKFVGGVTDFLAAFNKLRENNDYLEDVFRFVDLPDEMYKGTLSVEKRDDNRFEIEFKDVSFCYPGSDVYALRHINFKFRIGERLAFVGMNGSGKTTFVKLLCRLYDPTEGQILLNGIDITRYDYDQYMRLFAVVFQDFSVFAFDVAGNVAASEEPDRAKVEDCLKRAGLWERIRQSKNGIDTYVTKLYDASGEDFSGGERQKLAIARALYKDSPFLIMDEPTAALDPLAEADIYSRLDGMVEDKTAVYISHRLSSCKFCDEIAVFDHGEIIQKGSHEKLLSDAGGKYYELWHAQAQYYQK